MAPEPLAGPPGVPVAPAVGIDIDLIAAIHQAFPDPVVVLEPQADPDGRIVDARLRWANAAATSFLTSWKPPVDGGASQAVADALVSQFLPAFRGQTAADMLTELVTVGTPLVIDDFVAPPQPNAPHAHVYDLRASRMGALVVATWRQVTATRLVSTVDATTDSMYRHMAIASPELIYRANQQRVITWASPNCETILGWSAAELVGRRMTELAHPEDLAGLRGAIEDLYAGSLVSVGTQTAALRIATKERGYRWMAMRTHSVLDEDDQPAGVVAGMLDVHEAFQARLAAESAQRLADITMLSMDVAAIGVTITNTEGRFTFANRALCAMLGYTRTELEGLSFAELTHPDDRGPGQQALKDLLSGRVDSFSQRKRYRTKDGGYLWVDVSVAAVRDSSGSVAHFINQVVDVTAEVANSQALQRSVRQFRMLAEHASDVVLQTDLDGIIRWISPSVGAVLGWDPGLLVGTGSSSLIAPEDISAVSAARSEALRSGQPKTVAARLRATSGTLRDMKMVLTPLLAAQEPAGVVVSCRDVTDERQAMAKLRASEERFRIGMQFAPSGMAVTDSAGKIVEANPALCELLSRTQCDLVGRRLVDLLPADVADSIRARIAELVAGRTAGVREEHRIVVGQQELWVDHSISMVSGAGLPRLFIHQLADQTAARSLHSELTFRANHDVLTGLFNRENLMRRLADRFGPAEAAPFGLLFCDIDSLKPVNDTYGHAAGDAVITAVADRLSHSLRRQDFIARVGGDEFVVLVAESRSEHDLLQTCQHLLQACDRPVTVDGVEIPISVSFGAALARPGEDAEDLLRRADRALYRAKRAGRNRAVGDDPHDA